MMVNQHGGQEQTRVVDQFEATDLGAPFKVILHKSVRVTTTRNTGEMVSYSIPDLDGLLRAIVITRILHDRKLFGAEIRFIRRALGIKQKDFAQRIEMSAEHLSRCESGSPVMSPTSEKLLRIFALKTVMKLNKVKACEAKTKLEDALDRLFEIIKPVAAHDVSDELVLHFHRSRLSSPDASGDDGLDGDGRWDDESPAKAA